MIHPKLRLDPTTDTFRRVDNGLYVDKLPPTARYKYVVADRGVRVGQREFAPGTVLGTGTVTSDYEASDLCEFEPAQAYDGPDPLQAGHILARLHGRLIVAEPLDAPADD